MKIYTRTGDGGETHVIGGRVFKDDVRVEAYGTIDELNAFVGDALSRLVPDRDRDLIEDLRKIQHQLFDVGADLAQVGKKRDYRVRAEMTSRLEQWIDRYSAECQPIRQFILPGGSAAASALHICRVVARRAERCVVTLCRREETNEEVRRYLNRLSDFFFTVARVANVRENVSDVFYQREASGLDNTDR